MEKELMCPYCGHKKTVFYPEYMNASAQRLSVMDIIDYVSGFTGITHKQMMEANAKKDQVLARQLCFYFAYYYTNTSLSEIGQCVSKQKHFMVVYGKQRIKDMLGLKYDDVCQTVSFIERSMEFNGYMLPSVHEARIQVFKYNVS